MTALRWPLVVLMACAPLAAQTPRFTTGTAAVRVDVLVTARNTPILGLTRRDFELRDNGVVQQITDVSQEILPLNLLCVLDVSGSVDGQPLERLKEATSALFGSLRARDRAALVTFAERLELHAGLTGDTLRLRAMLDEMKAGGATSVIDATFAGLALREPDDARTVMLLFSDGRDTASWLSAHAALESAGRSDVVIYPVTVKPVITSPFVGSTGPLIRPNVSAATRSADLSGEHLLEAFAEETGGRVLYAERDDQLRATFAHVLAEFRQRYVLSYSPSGVSDGGWHAVDVRVVGRKAQVKARRGYAAEPTRGGASKARGK